MDIKKSETTWKIHWNDSEKMSKWVLGTPSFKYCKKRKEFFSEEFPDTWYKSPYKYHMMLTGKDLEPGLCVQVDVVYDDFTKINEECLSKQDCQFVLKDDEYQAKLGPFQFNVCSYKHEGKKFRLIVTVFSGVSKFVTFTSPNFIIKAKKPIVKPGIKGKKRKREDDKSIVKLPKIERDSNFEQNKYVLLKPKNLDSVAKMNFYPNVTEQPKQEVTNELFETCIENFDEFFKNDAFSELNGLEIKQEGDFWKQEEEIHFDLFRKDNMLESFITPGDEYFN